MLPIFPRLMILLQHKEVYDDQETNHIHPQVASDEGDGGLAAYDRHVEAAGSTEGVATADVPREPLGDRRPSGTRRVDSHAVPWRTWSRRNVRREPRAAFCV